jgi:low affinity Fe/Cu permease
MKPPVQAFRTRPASGPTQSRPVRLTVMNSAHTTGSRLLHGIDQLTSRPMVAWVLLSGDLIWVVFSVAVGFPSRLETIFQTLVAALTLALVFVIQHTQTREQLVTQRKLDEILRALPGADNAVIGLEDATDGELSAVHQDHRQLREEATGTL